MLARLKISACLPQGAGIHLGTRLVRVRLKRISGLAWHKTDNGDLSSMPYNGLTDYHDTSRAPFLRVKAQYNITEAIRMCLVRPGGSPGVIRGRLRRVMTRSDGGVWSLCAYSVLAITKYYVA